MRYLNVKNLTKSYGGAPLIDQLSFSIKKGDKIALVAKNGGGKTTLLKLLMQQLDLTDGEIIFRPGVRVGYLSQDFSFPEHFTVLDALFATDHPSAKLMKTYEEALLNPDIDSEKFQQLLAQIEEMHAWDYEAKVKMIISRLQLFPFLGQSIGSLSGGELKRVALARALIEEPAFLILDEPTNHLDIQMIEWLENYFKSQEITLFMVTHDRYFLERVCNQIYELDRGKLYIYPGNYSYFLEKKALREENEKIETQKMRQLLKRELVWMRKAPRARASKQQYREKKFYTIEQNYDARKERSLGEQAVFAIPAQERRLGTKIVKIKNLQKRYGEKVIIKDFNYDFKYKERIGILGKNGVGKSTFIKMLLGIEDQDSWILEIGTTVVFGHYQQGQLDFPEGKKLIEVVKAKAEYLVLGNGERISAAQMLERFLFPAAQQHTQVQFLSGGEKRRLALLLVLMENPNFLILDEPTNDLDLLTLNILEEFLLQFQGCLLIISHDRSFMDRIVDHLLIFEGEGVIKDFWGNYSDYHFLQQEKQKDTKSEKSESLSSVSSDQKKKLSYHELRERDQIAQELEELELQKEELWELLDAEGDDYEAGLKWSLALAEVIKQIEEKEGRWFELSERA